MRSLSQPPREPAFVQDPYPFYDRARALGPLFLWEDYGFACAAGYEAVSDAVQLNVPPPAFETSSVLAAGLAPPSDALNDTLAGEIANFTGIDSPYERPERPGFPADRNRKEDREPLLAEIVEVLVRAVGAGVLARDRP